MKWVDDLLAVEQIQEIGLKSQRMFIAESEIELTKSRENFARDEQRLDDEHVDSIMHSILKDGSIPEIVVRKIPDHGTGIKYVIAGGNHRDAACRKAGIVNRQCLVVECSDSEFLILCRTLNVVVGSGSTSKQRISHAVDAILNQTMDIRQACLQFNVSRHAVNSEIRKRKELGLLKSRVFNSADRMAIQAMEVGKRKALSKLQPGEVFDSAFSVAKDKKIKPIEFDELVDSILKLPTLNQQLGVIQAFVKEKTSKVKSPKRAKLIKLIKDFESFVQNVDNVSLSAIGVKDSEIHGVKLRCKKIANILNSL